MNTNGESHLSLASETLSDEEYVALARARYSDDDLLIQSLPNPDTIPQVVEREGRDGGVWVMAWVRVDRDPRTRIWVNDDRTVLVTQYGGGTAVAHREAAYHTWGPPEVLKEEKP